MTNMAIWDALSKTDPAHTKGFSRAGGFKGTAIKPQWVVQRLTEQFGPCGKGWGIDKPEFQVVQAGEETLVFCTVGCWYEGGDDISMQHLHGVGGDKVTTKRQNGAFNDDEAFKKAFTDAVMNAFKFLGVAADVHMGRFDDNKYVQEVAAEFDAAKKPVADKTPARVKLDGPYTSKTALWQAVRAFDREVRSCGDSDQLEAFLSMDDSKALINQVMRDAEALWVGGDTLPAEFEPLETLIRRLRDEFAMEGAR